MPSASFRHDVHTTASAAQAWTALQDPDTWGSLAGVSEIRNAKHDHAGDLVSYDFTASAAAKTYDGTATTVVSDAPLSMAVEIVSSEMDGRISIEIIEETKSTRGTVTLSLETKGFLSSMFFTIIKQVVGAAFPQQAENLADRFES